MRNNDLSPRPARRVLLDHPQPLGILPTRWFWRQPENRRAIMVPYGLMLLTILLGLAVVNASVLVSVGVTVGILGLCLGAFERYIRHKALRRRQALDEGSPSAELPCVEVSEQQDPASEGDCPPTSKGSGLSGHPARSV